MRTWRRLLLPFAAAVTLAVSTPALATGDGLEGLVTGSPAAGIYGSNHLAQLPDKAVLVFDYRFEGTLVEKPFDDSVLLDFTRHEAKGASDPEGFDVAATLFPHTRNLQIGPLSATHVNPILLIFFQRDASQMSNGTGGSQHYFRNAIRRVLQTPDPESTKPVTVEFGGKQVAASEITFRPFADSPDRARLREFADKSYHFIVSDDVPGGIYEVSAETPTGDGTAILLRETYRLREMRP